MKPVLPFAEIMVTQACNLSCAGCTNYSDLVHKGYLTWSQAQDQIEPWLERVTIPDFGLIGGEPLLNPEIDDWLVGIRKLMPTSQIRFTTNGILLHKFPELINLCRDLGNIVFKITQHTDDAVLIDTINNIKEKFQWDTIAEHGIQRWRTTNNLRLQINQPKMFIKTFKGSYANMQPYHNDPAQAFDVCCQKTCPLLYNGMLYKCSTTALLADVLDKFHRPNFAEWQPYIPDGLSPHCTKSDLDKFINNFGNPNKLCAQCPTISDTNSNLIHFNNVTNKKIT